MKKSGSYDVIDIIEQIFQSYHKLLFSINITKLELNNYIIDQNIIILKIS